MSQSKLSPTDVMSLAKGLYNLHKAQTYFRSVNGNPKIAPNAKIFLLSMLNKIDWCLREMKLRMAPENIAMFEQEITNGDNILFDNVFDEMIRMAPEQRDMMERVAIGIRRGEIQFVE